MKKTCDTCQSTIEKKSTESITYWATKHFCSMKCYWTNKKGSIPSHVKLWKKGQHISPKTQFKKGQVSPRKGVKAPQSAEHLAKRIANIPRGEYHWNWKGGITSENEKIRKSIAYRTWRMKVFKRDWFTCTICKYKGKGIEADHIKPFYLYPNERLSVSNGRTLCKSCHRKTDTWGRKVYTLQKNVIGQNI